MSTSVTTLTDTIAEAIARTDREMKRIAELASLSPIDYDHVREEAAKELEIRVSTLDDEVAKRRPGDEPEKVGGAALVLEDPKPWPEPVAGDTLLELITIQIARHLVASDEVILITALWVLFTHAHDVAGVSPTLCVTSPEKGCGKTTLLSLLDGLVKRALPASNISRAALYRTVEKCSPTLLVDEADTFLKENEELRGILNSGHARHLAYVVRCEGEKNEPRRFTTWCPKAIAFIGVPHPTLADRSIHIALTRKRSDESVSRLPIDCRTMLADLQRKCVRWAADNLERVKHAQPFMPTEFSNRVADNYRPIFALADVIGGEWPEKVRQAALRLWLHETDEREGAGVKLLSDIRTIFQDRHTDRLRSIDLVEALTDLEDRPWPEWRHGKPITAPQVAKLLKPFTVSPRTVRFPEGPAKGYHLDWFKDAFTRYLSPHPSSLGADTQLQLRIDGASSVIRAVTPDPLVTATKSSNCAEDKVCNRVTAPHGGEAREVVDLC